MYGSGWSPAAANYNEVIVHAMNKYNNTERPKANNYYQEGPYHLCLQLEWVQDVLQLKHDKKDRENIQQKDEYG